MTPVFIEDKINVLESNGILVRKAGGKYTTYVNFKPQTYSRESDDKRYMKQYEAAEMLVREYVPQWLISMISISRAETASFLKRWQYSTAYAGHA